MWNFFSKTTVGADSLLLEVRWRQKNDVPIDRKTVENVAQQCKRPTVVVLDGLYKLSETGTEVTPIFWNGAQFTKYPEIPGKYPEYPENHPENPEIFVTDTALELRRGSWFLAENFQPINPEYAAQIEEHHLKNFRGQNIPEGQVFFDKDNTKKLR